MAIEIGRRKLARLGVAGAAALAGLRRAKASPAYGPGVSDTGIKLGQTIAYSGNASAYGTIGKAQSAYFAMLNDHGGINGRKINFISLDDALSPPKTVEQTRKLVEEDEVFALFAQLGTPTVTAVRHYTNLKKVPQLFSVGGASGFGDYKHYPWSIGWQPNYQTEAKIYGKYLLEAKPGGKVAVLYQNDDFGKDYVKGLREGLGERADAMVVATASYEVTDPTVDSQIVALQSSGADVFFNGGTPKFGAQAIRKAYEIGWHPLIISGIVGNSVRSVMVPAGPDKAKGVLTGIYTKDPSDPQWEKDPARLEWLAWMQKYYPSGDPAEQLNEIGYLMAQTMEQTLRQCGDDLTRENLMRQATNLDMALPMLLPGVRIKTTPTDYYPIKQIQLARFDGTRWVLFGDLISG
jgi:branched-chain amino acid transport system substrate-binding protein